MRAYGTYDSRLIWDKIWTITLKPWITILHLLYVGVVIVYYLSLVRSIRYNQTSLLNEIRDISYCEQEKKHQLKQLFKPNLMGQIRGCWDRRMIISRIFVSKDDRYNRWVNRRFLFVCQCCMEITSISI